MTRRLLAAATAAFALLAAPASAAEGDPYFDSCLTPTAVASCAVDPFVDAPYASAMSGDGKHVYVAVIGDDSTRGTGILQFDRTAGGGLVRHPGTEGCITTNGNPATGGGNDFRCQVGSNLAVANGMHIVGNSLYLTAITGNALLVFDINPANGVLTQKPGVTGCIHNGAASGGCAGATGLAAPGAMAHKADGSELYVRTSFGLAVFSRAGDGTLSQEAGPAGCWHEDGGACSNGSGLGSSTAIRQIAVVGDNLYVPFGDFRDSDTQCTQGPFGPICFQVPDFHGGVSVFTIGGDGTLSQAADATRCLSNDGQSGVSDAPECTTSGVEDFISAISATGEGSDLYLGIAAGVYHYRRGDGGALADGNAGADGHQPAGCVRPTATAGCTANPAARSAVWLGLTPDGSELVVANEAEAALGFLLRDATSGTLTSRADPADCFSRNGAANAVASACQVMAALSRPATLTFSPDGLMLFSTGNNEDGIVAFDRDFAPSCQAKTADAAFNTSVAVPLTCADPNGDPLTLEITQPPINGALAAVDQANASVRYSPALGFSGTDGFKFRALSRGGTVNSDAAAVTVNVASAPTDNDKDGVSPPADCDDNNAAVRPGAAEVPGNGVDEDCVGGDQALPPGRIAFGVDFFFDARNKRFTKVGRLDVTSIVAGATLQVRCIGGKKKGCRFKSKKRTFPRATAKFSAKRYFNFTKKVRKKKRKIVSKLKKGTKIELRVTAPGLIGKVVTFTTRRGKVPTFTVTCLPVGATKPQKTC